MQAKVYGSLIGAVILLFLWLRDGTISFDHPVLLAVLAIACLPTFGLWAWLLFGSTDNALRAARWPFIGDTRSLLRGDYVEDKFAEVRLGLMVVFYAATVAAVYTGVLAVHSAIS